MPIRLNFTLAGMIAFGALLATSASGQEPANLTFLYSDDDPENLVRMEEIVAAFNEAHDDIDVEFISTGYNTILRQLPLQLAVGEGPDIARVTDRTLGRYALDLRPLLKDPEGFEALYGASLSPLRQYEEPGSDAINGITWTQTLNLPFVNVTLFEQAGVDIPEPGATLDEIVAASVEVAEATGVAIPFTLDRSGHRITGPLLSAGADIISEDGVYTFPDEAARSVIEELYGYTLTGAFPPEMWGAAGGSAYKSMGEEFANANAVTYLSGNWMVGALAGMIGDAFEWTAIQAPCGPGGCVAMPGGSSVIAFEHTRYPEAAAAFMEYIGSEDIQRALAEEFILVPGADIEGLDYKTDDPNVQNAMKVFNANRDTPTPQAYQLNVAKGNTAFFTAVVQRLSQMIVGELSVEQTFDTLKKDMDVINAEVAAQE
ncbi:ABC transporter substrate-binding protein [Martelella radicis]|uniref:Alpha-1,4-digalacturonate transport system substrate-binding protein n=1 Tax=Martelella radicis TaxID=1397476 RepID=A0A7W6PBS3_9HYPH|nr:ABC transporter substrate-binding protein [Martelella radicis]MBB4123731.1 alpha-1,4-digalacturonate transport system substrate-binding protein [Martelella radicis]